MDVHWLYYAFVFHKVVSVYSGEILLYSLNDGNKIPAVALGTSLGHLADGTRVLPVNHSLAQAVQWALEDGYRHIDTASLYKVEDEVGLGIRNYVRDSRVDRRDIYVTTKLWNDAHERDEVRPALKKSLEELGLDYVDLYLMHYPMAYKKDGNISQTDYVETWKGLENVKEANLTKSIGVSNFNLSQMQRLWERSRIKPAVLQIELDRKLVAIPRSTNKDRIKQNIDLMDFSLTSEEVEELSSFNSNYRLRTPAKWYPHPHFPFERKNLTSIEIEHIIANSKDD
ncbi:aldo-keto reductase AKR2E4 isoform X3 [Pieris rapae]|uniref:aldo-keto reductase AKR2E4 isoform X3 n=1 Tax=Pieris rapae TaxID=64459 RepID=UPI001E280FB5|nr:aldo-keto reductase AKR2E4 isoform X3 [Pieris rapae]